MAAELLRVLIVLSRTDVPVKRLITPWNDGSANANEVNALRSRPASGPNVPVFGTFQRFGRNASRNPVENQVVLSLSGTAPSWIDEDVENMPVP